ncbi:RHS repeat-associated core domain-containing protein [Exilibacterium tricleocarpae]|uniref:RHS repeat-associated core domain-containing protein n=1 Tax=Exilibacterium tricleocarpae TaxID=2591008 RepID=UPI0015D3A4E9|nr:RHS repeat-associated core domain-containing protein [Exilibacterium tricleocarpae]
MLALLATQAHAISIPAPTSETGFPDHLVVGWVGVYNKTVQDTNDETWVFPAVHGGYWDSRGGYWDFVDMHYLCSRNYGSDELSYSSNYFVEDGSVRRNSRWSVDFLPNTRGSIDIEHSNYLDYIYDEDTDEEETEGCGIYTFEVKLFYKYVAPATPASISTVPANPGANGNYTVSWASVSGANYELQQQVDGGSWSTVNSSGTSKSFSGQAQGSTFRYRVRAFYASNGYRKNSDWRYSSNITVPYEAPVISLPSSDTDGNYTVSWNSVAGATNYTLQEKSANGSWGTIQDTSATSKTISGKSNGTYSYRVRACNPQLCSGYSSAGSIVVGQASQTPENIDTPPVPQLQSPSIVSPQAQIDTDKVNTISGDFRVNESGSATYTIPIIMAEGTAGVRPDIGLTYANAAPIGVAGRGWSISGIGDISRCRQTLVQDNRALPISWSTTDRFCLNGTRLILHSGTYGSPGSTYKTEIDSFVLVTAVGGSAGHPDYFTVAAKDGSTTRYGDSGDSDAEKVAYVSGARQANRVLSWSISRFEDSVGNRITYHYQNSENDHLVDTIDYAYGNATSGAAQIRFQYENRPDVTSVYVAGYEFKRSQRLAEVVSYNDNAIVRRYVLHYLGNGVFPKDEISRLQRIDMCVDGHCHTSDVSTEFEWRVPGYTFSLTPDHSEAVGTDRAIVSYQFADINGDGKSDMVWVDVKRVSGGYHYKLSYRMFGESAVVVKNFTQPERLLDTKIHVLDYNADGKQDIYFDNKLYLASPIGDGDWHLPTIDTPTNITLDNPTFTDINGDGLADVVDLTASGVVKVQFLERDPSAGPASQLFYRYSDPQTFRLTGVDIGDWQTQLLVPSGRFFHKVDVFTFGDFNGDGQTDIAFNAREELSETCRDVGDEPSEPEIQCFYTYDDFIAVFLKEGDQFAFFDRISLGTGRTEDDQLVEEGDIQIYLAPSVDVNGDGLTDLVYAGDLGDDTDTWQFMISTGSGFLPSQTILAESSFANKAAFRNPTWLDYNLDGYTDFIWLAAGSNDVRYKSWDPASNSFASSSSRVASAFVDEGRTYIVNDINGDGWHDFIHFDTQQGLLEVRHGNGTAENRPDLIYKITDGLGNETDIRYGTLNHSGRYTSSAQGISTSSTEKTICIDIPWQGGTREYCYTTTVYENDTSAFYTMLNTPFADLAGDAVTLAAENHAPVLEIAGAAHVVIDVYSSSPTTANPDNKVGVSYFYHQLRAQAAGRGLLGFKRLSTWDHQSEITTTTTYRQDWPFIGQPLNTVTESPNGKVISESENSHAIYGLESESSRDAAIAEAEANGTAALGALQVYSAGTTDRAYKLAANGSAQGVALSTVVSEFTPDAYGNMVGTLVTTYAGDSSGSYFSRVETANAYAGEGNGEFLGRLIRTDVTTQRPGVDTAITPASVTKTARFSYYGINGAGDCAADAHLAGMLCEESVEVGGGVKSTQRHYYDGFGNKSFTYAFDDGGQHRLSPLSEYDNATGRYVDRVYDVFSGLLNNTGAALSSRYLNKASSLNASVRLVSEVTGRNHFGLPTQSITYVDGNSTVETTTAYTPYGAAYFSADSTGAYKATTAAKTSGLCPAHAAYTTTEHLAGGGEKGACYDSLGRVIRDRVKSFAGNLQNYRGWVFSDTEYDFKGRTLRVSQPYFQGDSVYWTRNLGFDLLDRPTLIAHAFYETDDAGNSTGVHAQSRISYDGFTTVTTNAEGQLKTEVTNVLGEIVSVINNQNAAVQYEYDVYGELVKMTDPAANQTRIHYNALGQKIWMDDPDMGRWEYAYTGFGDLTCQKDAKGQIIKTDYDFKGRMIRRRDYTGGICSSPAGLVNTATWEYDTASNGVGQLSVESDSHNFARAYYYDTFGRADVTTTEIPGDNPADISYHSSKVTYDDYGRVFQIYDAARDEADFSQGAVQNIYDDHGYLWRIADAHRIGGDFATEYYQINAMDQLGNVVAADMADGVISGQASYNGRTGLLERLIASSNGGLTILQDMTMKWDHINNLRSRHDQGHKGSGQRRNLLERFDYDGANQLISYVVSGDADHTTTVEYSSDGIGNIHNKSDVGNYDYANGRPHAVSRAGGVNYGYDSNGDMTSGDGRALEYTVFRKVSHIEKSATHYTDFFYGTDRGRYKRIDRQGAATTTTLYIGSVEKVYFSDNSSQWKRTINGIAQITMDFNQGLYQQEEIHYLIKDHLGSVTTIVNELGQALDSMAFDPWGARRDTESWEDLALSLIQSNYYVSQKPITTRGFTGHEMVDEMGIIHMGGRIYEPKLGRFMQADTIIQSPTVVGSLNRYSYTWNNPLNATDPSGHFVEFFIALIATYAVGEIAQELELPWLATIAQIAGCYYGSCVASSFGSTYGLTGDFNAAFKSALIAGVSPHAYGAAADLFSGVGLVLAHGVIGGVNSVIQGGKFGHGFVSAGITKAVNVNHIATGLSDRATLTRISLAAIIGGTMSAATGGKFANGAISGAFGQMFNGETQCPTDKVCSGASGAQKEDLTGAYSPVPGTYLSENGEAVTVDLQVYGNGNEALVSADGTTAYQFDYKTGLLVSPLATGAAASVCPECYLVGAGGLLRAVFGGSKSAFVTVTSWAPAGTTADLAAGRWVVMGEATRWNFIRTGLWGPQMTVRPFSFSWGSGQGAFTPVTGQVLRSRVGYGPGLDGLKGALFGQRYLRH